MSKKLSPELKPSTMDFVVKGITHCCKTFKKRSPGSKVELEAQNHFSREVGQWADSVTMEAFSLHPHAFLGFFSIPVVLATAGSIVFFFNRFNPSMLLSVVSFALLFLAMVITFAEFIFYREFIDFLFPKATSYNLYAVRKAEGEVKKRLIFGGHADAPWEFTYFRRGGLPVVIPGFVGAIGGGIVSTIIILIYIISGTPAIEGFWSVFSFVLLALIPFFLIFAFFVNWKVVCDGANDNLSACYASMAIMKELAENDIRFENTEVCCLITGSEEAGLRGAKAFCKKHGDKLKQADTIFIPFEVLRETQHLTVYNRDLNGTVRCDKELIDLLLSVGNKLDIPLKCTPIPLGATDAAAFAQAGLRAAPIGGSDDKPQPYYHTRLDSYDNISPECIEKAIQIGLETAFVFDAGEKA